MAPHIHTGRPIPRPAYWSRAIAAVVASLGVMAVTLGAAPAVVSAQAVRVAPALQFQPHVPINPLVVERSSLSVQPYLEPAAGWSWGAEVEYGSVVERNLNFPDSYLLDAELVRATVQLRRDLSRGVFVLAEGGVAGAYSGVADGFFESYHRLIRFTMEERDTRPRDRYGDRLVLRSHGIDRERAPRILLPADVRVAVGFRSRGLAQTVVSATLPTAPAASAYHRGVVSVALLQTIRVPVAERLGAELTGGVGYTPRTGSLEPVQRTTFLLGSAAAQLRLWGRHAVFATLYGHGAPYRDTRFPELDASDLGVDFGYTWLTRQGRQWRVGLTEDLRRRDPGVDLVLKVSTSH